MPNRTTLSQAELSSHVDGYISSFVASDAPGGAVLVVEDGLTLHKAGYGLADLEQGLPITPQSLFQIASVGKQFTALGLVMLAEDGRLALDDEVGKHLPQLTRFGPEVTLRRIMQHISGLPNYDVEADLMARLLAMAPMPTNDHELTLLSQHGELRFAPGERFEYNNFAYEVLGSVIEQVSGQPFQEFMAARIFDPVNMTSTFSQPNPERLTDPKLAHSYIRKEGQIRTYDSDPMDHLVGAGSVYSTVEDMARYDQALQGESLIKQSALSELFRPAVLNDGSRSNYGLGWEIGETRGQTYMKHGGDWLGFISYYVRFPARRLGVMAFFNRNYDLPEEDVAMKIAELYLNP